MKNNTGKKIISLSLIMLLGACSSHETVKDTDTNAAAYQVATPEAQQLSSETNPLRDPNNLLSRRVVYFDFDKDTVRPEFSALLQAHSNFLHNNPGRKIRLEGHADDRGSREYNLALGQRRDNMVGSVLSILGISMERVESISFGDDKPAVRGHDEASWKQNRRVEIVYDNE